MIKKTDHLVITSGSIEDTMSFYQKLGFECKNGGGRYELYAGDFKINVHLLGHELNPHAKNIQPGSTDICFEITESLEAFKNELFNKGLEIELGIVERNGVNGRMQSLYLRDPDGNLIEFCSYC